MSHPVDMGAARQAYGLVIAEIDRVAQRLYGTQETVYVANSQAVTLAKVVEHKSRHGQLLVKAIGNGSEIRVSLTDLFDTPSEAADRAEALANTKTEARP
jgi:hypothetical protein